MNSVQTRGVENLASNSSRFCGSKASRREKWISPSAFRASLVVATKEISNKRMQRLLAFPAHKLTITKEYLRVVAWAHEFNAALTWIFLTHLRGTRAVFELQLKSRASYFRATRLIHTSDYYSPYKDEQKSWCDCSNLCLRIHHLCRLFPSRHQKTVERRPGYTAWWQ